MDVRGRQAGGHIEPGEDPWSTAVRECVEEPHVPARARSATGPHPLFVTVTRTRRGLPHTDVALWFVLDADPEQITSYDEGEFAGIRWWPVDTVQEWLDTRAADDFEPHLGRFLTKFGRGYDQGPVAHVAASRWPDRISTGDHAAHEPADPAPPRRGTGIGRRGGAPT